MELHKWGGVHASHLHPIDGFMADFGLTDEGKIILNKFSETTSATIHHICYAELAEALANGYASDGSGRPKRGLRRRVRDAVQRERTRLRERHVQDELQPASESKLQS